MIRFEKVPTSGHDLEALIRWQMRKSVPFRVDEAQVTWAEGQSLEAGGREFVVAIARREIIAQYENVVSRGGSHVGLVDLATFNLVNLVLAQEAPDDWLLVHVAADSTTLAIVRRRAGDLLPSAWRRRGGEPGRPRASVEDVLRRSAVGSRLRTRRLFRRRVGTRRGRRGGPAAPAAGGSAAGKSGRDRSRAVGDVDRSNFCEPRAGRSAGAARGYPVAGAGGMSLRTNLATRPFYNERAVQVLLVIAAVAVAAITRLQRAAVVRAHVEGSRARRRRRHGRRQDARAQPRHRADAHRHRRRARGGRLRRGARSERGDRAARLLVDGSLQPPRGRAARERAPRIGQAGNRPSRAASSSPLASSRRT